MRIIILHYHLNPGGVTSIIGSQIQALKIKDPGIHVTVLCGNNSSAHMISGIKAITDESFNYAPEENPAAVTAVEIKEMAAFIKRHLTKTDILHCHNANLGKNPALTATVYSLALEGYRIVNHCHDFAEDRPDRMDALRRAFTGGIGSPEEIMYPVKSGYQYIVLNSCDFRRLSEHVPRASIHLLPNPVTGMADHFTSPALKSQMCATLGIDPVKRICTYPVRAIRRKNLGEFLLLAMLYGREMSFVVTQAPRNPVEIPGYMRWKLFSEKNKLNVKFEAGDEVPYEELIRISDFCITTSIKEGFGMVFLEPWLAGTPVVGRHLPCTTDDLLDQGMMLTGLYKAIRIETSEGIVDYPQLDIEAQEAYLDTLHQTAARDTLLQENPFLTSLFNRVPAEIIEKNKSIIKQRFSAAQYGKRLFAIYQGISG
jgi:glycosyltransferase involved in cell wall biosynthesis